MTLPRLACQDGTLQVVGEGLFKVTQRRQILHVEDFCNDCGNCTTFCVHNGQPHKDKPRLFLNEEDFERAQDNAFRIQKAGQRWVIRRRENSHETRLMLDTANGGMRFDSAELSLELGPDLAVTSMELKKSFDGTFSLRHAAEMSTILKGVLDTLPFLAVERRSG